MRARLALIAALALGAAPLWAQSFQNGGPLPGDQGIGAMPQSQQGQSLGQSAVPQAAGTDAAAATGAGAAPSTGASGEQNAINQAVESALQSAAESGGQAAQGGAQDSGQPVGQGAGQQTGQDTGQAGNSQYSGQGGFVSDGTGLGHVTNNSAPAVQSGPRMETVKVTQAPGGVVRWLDKVSGQTVDIPLKDGQSKTQGRLTIKLTQCRYPLEDPSSNAFAYLIIHDSLVKKPIFQGWMIASSPALDPLDSPRYDVWLLRCTTS
ncbi:MAG: DUF2155 domain-containing protein [Allgaiera sp.]|jgi:hypothetical protein|nr:DUF2155 domain-containing protein [Allgaiera sp.]